MGTFSGKSAFRDTLIFNIAATAAGATSEIPLYLNGYLGNVTKVTFIPSATITGAATNNRTLSLINKGAAGSGTTVIATLNFANGVNATAFVAKNIPLSGTSANLDFVVDSVITWKSELVGTGIADPGGLLIVELARD